MEQNKSKLTIIDSKEKPNNNTIMRVDSPNLDNESNTILFKYNSNLIENIKESIKNQEKNKNIYSHDKEIMEDSIIYFSKKLKKNNIEYHKYLYASILIYIIDFIIWYFDKDVIHSKFNLYTLSLIFIIDSYQLYIFRQNCETISKNLYSISGKIIYIYSCIVTLFLTNMLYISFNILYNTGDNIYIFYHKKMFHFLALSMIIFLYIILNFTLPIIILVQLINLKGNIKNLASAKGEVYEPVKDVKIINSIIN